ncbi:MAG: glycosyltransferase family 4 protein [Alphaproteobacteria bacterium]
MIPVEKTRPLRSGPRVPAILQVLPELVTGGVERGTVDVAAAVASMGWVSIVASAGGPMVADLERVGSEHITLPLQTKRPWTMHRNAGALTELIFDRKVDIVHARSRAPGWSAMIAAKRIGTHFVTTYHGTYNATNPIKNFYNSVMARGERVIAISDFIARHIQQRHGVDPGRIVTIHRGVDVGLFDPERVSAERMIQLATAWRLQDGMPVIMLPGRLTRWKGQNVLIDALGHLGRDDVRCLLVGSDQGRTGYRYELEKLVHSRNLDHVVHIVDHCRDMPAAYMLADVVVSASTDPEGFGRVAVEAQAMGRPVVATDHGGARETVRPGETGWLVPPGDAKALADAISAAIAMDATARAKMATVARAHVVERFTAAQMRAATIALYQDVLGLTPQGPVS